MSKRPRKLIEEQQAAREEAERLRAQAAARKEDAGVSELLAFRE